MNRAPVEPLTATARLRFAAWDTISATRLYALRSLRQVDALVASVVMPLIFILIFGYVFGGSIDVPGGRYEPYLLSGIVPQSALFSAGTVAVAVAADMREGVIDRLRTMPVARSSTLFGRTFATIISGLPGLSVMTLCAFAVGLRARHGLLDAVGAFTLMLFFAWAMMWVGVVIGLLASGPGAANGLSLAPSLFFSFVSNVYVDPAHMPAWLRVIADWNPLSVVVTAVRRLLGIALIDAPTHVVTLEYPIPAAVLLITLLLVVLVPISVRLYARVG